MANSQWRFEPVVWGAPKTDKDRKRRNDRGGICFDVLSADGDAFVAALELAWLAEPDPVGATVEFTLRGWAAKDMHAFPDWVAHGRLVPQPGGVAISQLSVAPDAPWFPGASLQKESDYAWNPGDPPPKQWMVDGGVTSGLLRKVPLGIVFAGVQELSQGGGDSPDMAQFLAHIAADYPDFSDAIKQSGGGSPEGESGSKKKGGRPGLPGEHLRELALAYLELAGQKGVHALLSKRFNKSTDSIKESIRAARRAGWLAPGQAGRRGAYPGPLLLEEREASGSPPPREE
ncbi:hypothetical protein [Streptomyces sp. NPDC127103]|uniref:hypothetical protein n=1 Tax=Streptomyces sp. NPDC127103 TaxID=3347139 RepID=UPI003655BCBF